MTTTVTKVIHHEAKFINQKGLFEDVSIITGIKVEKWGKRQKMYYCKCKIRDCKSSIEFNISIGSKQEFENSVHKLTTVINSLSKFKAALIKQGITPNT